MNKMSSYFLLAIAAVIMIFGCSRLQTVAVDEKISFNEHVRSVQLNGFEYIEFNKYGGKIALKKEIDSILKFCDSSQIYSELSNRVFSGHLSRSIYHPSFVNIPKSANDKKTNNDTIYIVGYDNQNKFRVINMADVSHLTLKKIHVGKTIFATIGIIIGAGVVAFVVMLATSCPLIDSFDGEKYHFDAEPLGGAICKGLQRTDLTSLEYLKKVDNDYKIKMYNQENETQYIDNVELVLVDHPANTLAVHDLFNNIYIIDQPLKPISVTDDNNKDLLKYFAENDKVIWQSSIYDEDQLFDSNTRHKLIFKFKKPANQKKIGFVFSATSSIWGSYMVKDILKLRGNKLEEWYERMSNGGPDIMQLHNFNEREEHYFMKFYVMEGKEWRAKGYIPSSAPLNSDLRIAWFNLTDFDSDTVEIMINPPKLFWCIDYAGIVSQSVYKPQTKILKVENVVLNNADNTLSNILNIDYNYLVLKNPDDFADITFKDKDDNFKPRTKFLRITGYYDIHFKNNGSEESNLIKKFFKEPGSILKYSMALYRKSEGVLE